MDRATFILYDGNTIHALSRHADLLAEAERDRRLGQVGTAGGRGPRLAGRLVATLERVAATAIRHWPDSRDGLRSPEQELAARGVTWATDGARDLELARELQAAHRHPARRAPVPVAMPTGISAPRDLPTPSERAAA